ncbi:hypothetical protein QQX98_011946 [Neonectria punicea]|uniref:Transcription factor domain-containing protein n=1 Tax=Neonectria punicea TaxID=979145 RepID=A0ABR1GKN7_9HYPO
MLGDWFDKVHPVAPILLRRRFMRRLRTGEADVDRTFCGLVVSVCAAVAATLPREDHGPVTVTRCLEFIDQNQLITGGFSRSSYSLDWATAMYNLGTAMGAVSESGLGDMRSFAASSEAAAGARYLAYYCMRDLDNVEKQLLKRLFWLLFAGSCSTNILGRLPVSLLSQELIDAIPRPLDLTDDQMEPPDPFESDHVAWHGDATSYVPGLNCLSDLFEVWHDVQLTPASADPAARLGKYLSQVQHVIDSLPPELRWRGGLSRPPNVTQGHDVQIANLFITSLHIRSNLLQKLDPTPKSLPEHQKIVDDLLEILYHLPQAVFNANGSSVVPKIRDIGAAYLEQVEKGHGTGQTDGDSARSKLERVLRKLDDLDCWQGIGLIGVLDNDQTSTVL